MRVRIPCLPHPRPDGETEDHTSVLTRSFGFESWSGHWDIRVVSSAGQSASMTRWRPQVRSLHRPFRRGTAEFGERIVDDLNEEGPPDRRRHPARTRASDEP